MSKATTFRLDPHIREGLFKLSNVLHLSANRLANEALKEYLDRRTQAVEQELEATLEDLRAYRRRDPDFDEAIAKVVEAEVNLVEDPAEGRIVSGPFAEQSPASASKQERLERLLRS